MALRMRVASQPLKGLVADSNPKKSHTLIVDCPLQWGRNTMHLADADILDRLNNGDLTITPIQDLNLQLQPASFDSRLDNTFLKFQPTYVESINPLEDDPEEFMQEIHVPDGEPFIIHPGDFVLASTKEWYEIPTDTVGFVDGRSTLGRLGLIVHTTAGLLDPGWEGNITLEMSNLGTVPIEVVPDMRIAQINFRTLQTEADRPYGPERGSRYQGQTGVTSARTDVDAGGNQASTD